MSKDRSYLNQGQKAIRQHRAQQKMDYENVKRREWTNYDDYIRDQRMIFEQMKAKPAKICGLCGYAMDYNGHKLTEWEETWSVHEVCKAKMSNYLDRESGVARERRRR